MPTAPPRLLGARLRQPAPRRSRQPRREPLRSDAEPARRRRADRRRRPLLGPPPLVGEGDLGRVAGLGLVRRDGDRQPLLARLHRRRSASRCSRWASSTTTASGPRLPLVGRNRPPADPEREPGEDAATVPPVSRAAAIKHGYTTGARGLASRSVDRPHPHPGHPERPDGERRRALRRRVDARALRGPERDPLLLARRGRLRRRLAARHPRRRARTRGRQDDAVRRVPRLDHRPRQRRLHADRDRLHPRDAASPRVRRGRDGGGRRLVPRLVHAREGRGRSACAATSASARAPSASS